MVPKIQKSQSRETSRRKLSAVGRTLLWAFAVSMVLHLVTVWRIGAWGGEARRNRDVVKPLTLRIKPLPDRKSGQHDQSIVETKQAPTAPPEVQARLGAQDHMTQRETRTENRPGASGEGTAGKAQVQKEEQVQRPTRKPGAKEMGREVEIAADPHGQIRVLRKGKARNAYEALLQDQVAQKEKLLKAGRTEYLDDKIAQGDRVDLNTTNYKYLSYFIGLRKSIELTWVYPSSAVRQGLQGEVRLEFKIEKDGRMTQIRVLNSSGYEILDRAILDAIKLAAPFAPLPKSMAKDSLVITATFRYVLYAYNTL